MDCFGLLSILVCFDDSSTPGLDHLLRTFIYECAYIDRQNNISKDIQWFLTKNHFLCISYCTFYKLIDSLLYIFFLPLNFVLEYLENFSLYYFLTSKRSWYSNLNSILILWLNSNQNLGKSINKIFLCFYFTILFFIYYYVLQALVKFLAEAHRGVHGFVLDENGNPIEKASVKIKSRDINFFTTKYGEFWRILLPGLYKLEVSFTLLRKVKWWKKKKLNYFKVLHLDCEVSKFATL